MSDTSRLQRIVRKNKVGDVVPLGATQLDAAIKENEFPKPVVLREGGKAVGFFEDELDSYLRYRRAKRDKTFEGRWLDWCAKEATP